MPMSAMKARFQIAECSSLYQKKKDGMILEEISSSTISLKQVDCHSYILFLPQNPR